MHTDFDRCVRAVQSKDARFDGWFFTAVLTTRVYCRPSCPAAPPEPRNMTFYPSAAAAEQAGFRACKRCRPDAVPGSPQWNARADLVARAMRLIADGVVDREGVPGLAAQLGCSPRQIERRLLAELGAGPLALARAQRARTARVLIETSTLPMGDVAFASGFSSIRTFNETVREVFALSPTELRARVARGRPSTAPATTAAPATAPHGALSLRLPFRQPLCPGSLFGHLAATGVPGVEEWRDGAYRRTLRLPHGHGTATVRPMADHIACRLALTDHRDLSIAISRCRWMLDLDADPQAVDEQLSLDPSLTPHVAASPGRRVPRTVDGAEFAVRAVLGQQVSTAAARTLAARLVAAHGEPVTDPDGGLTHLFPTPEALAGLAPQALAMPRTRRTTLTTLVAALADGGLDLGVGGDWQRARAALDGLPGMGPWTAEIIAMRALGDPDAFIPTDLGVRLAARGLGLPSTPAALTSHAAAWRPWRAYAVQYLWATGDHAINRLPTEGLPAESLPAETLPTESLPARSLRPVRVRAESRRTASVRPESPSAGSPSAENVV
ncbi:AlkA N-terminal domain-containing protein [Wenjunlia tyrosinilytica]|uniref:AlkA N-terminal domain-containing protein n=1 Tax=Wenjunlia tyrosinilytica TaxID=1544741 RepID=UPI00166B4789|nr:AlkA N-terminal domain-containing protein [Wenjunlia tyrosinilytica]